MSDRLWLSPRVQKLAARYDGDAARGMRALARQLLADSRLSSPPFHPDLLAPGCGVSQIRSMDIPQHGLLVNDGAGLAIYVSRRFPVRSTQWNAICAHELGHALLLQYGNGRNGGRAALASTPEEETLCDLAARELLLPMPVMLSELQKSGDEVFSIESVARAVETFRAPPRMAAARLVESGLCRGLAAQWKPQRGSSRDLRLVWSFGEAPAHAPRLSRRVAAATLFGTANRIELAWATNAATMGLEALAAGNAWWFVRSGPFEELGHRCVISLVRFA